MTGMKHNLPRRPGQQHNPIEVDGPYSRKLRLRPLPKLQRTHGWLRLPLTLVQSIVLVLAILVLILVIQPLDLALATCPRATLALALAVAATVLVWRA